MAPMGKGSEQRPLLQAAGEPQPHEGLKKVSTIPLIFAVQLATLAWAIQHAWNHGALTPEEATRVWAALALVALWGLVTGVLTYRGFYVSQGVLASLPAIWVPLLPVLVCMVPFSLSPTLQSGVAAVVDAAPPLTFLCLQGVRALAVGSLLKWRKGLFPTAFAWVVAFPDMLFGASAWLLAAFEVTDGAVSRAVLAAWNVLGATIIVPVVPVVLQLGLPGLFHVYDPVPSNDLIFEWPMGLAPSLVVPLFVVVNLAVAWRSLRSLPGMA